MFDYKMLNFGPVKVHTDVEEWVYMLFDFIENSVWLRERFINDAAVAVAAVYHNLLIKLFKSTN